MSENLIVDLLLSSEGISTSEVARQLKMSRNTVTKYLAVLQAKGVVACRETGPAKVWFINNKGKEMIYSKKTRDLIKNLIETEKESKRVQGFRFPLDVESLKKALKELG